jgi:hypothetical protein
MAVVVQSGDLLGEISDGLPSHHIDLEFLVECTIVEREFQQLRQEKQVRTVRSVDQPCSGRGDAEDLLFRWERFVDVECSSE